MHPLPPPAPPINWPQSPGIGQNSEGGISDFRISGQSLIKENCHNSRTSDDIDRKLRPVYKIDKRNNTKSKKFDVDVMLENCDVIVIIRISGQFGAVQRPDSRHRVGKSYVSVIVTFYLTKTANRTKL